MNQDAIQKAVYDALVATPGMPPVYDDVPEGAEFPYVVVGDDVTLPFDDDCGSGGDSLITIHAWSTYKGRSEVKQILAQIYSTLHRSNLVIAGSHLITIHFDWQTTLLDPDGLTRHGILRFRLLTREA